MCSGKSQSGAKSGRDCAARSRHLLSRARGARRALRRALLRRRAARPASIAGRSARRARRSSRTSLLPERGRGAGGGLPPLPALPARRRRPSSAAWRGTSNTVSRALALIAEGALDGEGDVEALAERLGVGERQLRRLFQQASRRLAGRRGADAARALRQAADPRNRPADGRGRARRRLRQRAALQRDVPAASIGRPPERAAPPQARPRPAAGGELDSARYSPPYDWAGDASRFLAARAIPGVERVEDGRYARTIAIDGARGAIAVSHVGRATRRARASTIRLPDVAALPRDRRPRAPRVRSRRRLRMRSARIWRAIRCWRRWWRAAGPARAGRLGRLRAGGARRPRPADHRRRRARGLAGKLVARLRRARSTAAARPALTHVFPTPAGVARADLADARHAARSRGARSPRCAAPSPADPALFEPRGSRRRDDRAALHALPGIGEWTAQYIAHARAARARRVSRPPTSACMRAGRRADGARPTPAALLARAEAWRPWRAYAAQHLWTPTRAAPATRDQGA